MDDKNKGSGSSLLGDILKDTYKQIIVPKCKEIINNALTDGIYMCSDYLANVVGKRIFGPGTVVGSSKTRSGKTAYSNISRSNNNVTTVQQQQQNIGMRSSSDLQYVVAESREQAEEWKNSMIASINKFGRVCVSDLYEKTGGKVKPLFNDFDFGWTKVEDIHYVRNSDGYWFNLPTPTRVK